MKTHYHELIITEDKSKNNKIDLKFYYYLEISDKIQNKDNNVKYLSPEHSKTNQNNLK